MNIKLRRRKFLQFLGYSALISKAPCTTVIADTKETIIKGISHSSKDELVLAKGLTYDVVIKWPDHINDNQQFGSNNDYIAFIPENNNSGLLWVNHESFLPLFVSGNERTKQNIDIERKQVGGSILRIKREGRHWAFVHDNGVNKRIDATTKIPFSLDASIKNSKVSEGTLANCAGGVTPWKTFLSCEENYHAFYGDYDAKTDTHIKSVFKWEGFYPNPVEHYGWVVEIDPHTHITKKHVTLGRFAHESATCVLSESGNTVVYSGDDKIGECLYKFIANKPNTLESGTLYVADTVNGNWLALDIEQNEILRKQFKDQIDVYVHARYAAALVGGTPLDRPEDIKINPITGDIFITLTNNVRRGNFHGEILKLKEKNRNYESLEFTTETFLTGGRDGFSSPDNLLFDQRGNLWFCTDVSGKAMHKPPYSEFKNNGLFVVPASGKQAGEVIQLASAPTDAELTGLCFDPKQKTLFLSVQHPGEQTRDLEYPTSHWPNKDRLPASAVVQIYGPMLESITQV